MQRTITENHDRKIITENHNRQENAVCYFLYGAEKNRAKKQKDEKLFQTPTFYFKLESIDKGREISAIRDQYAEREWRLEWINSS